MILITENHSFQYDMENLAEIFFPYEKIKVLGELPEEKDNITVITRACGNEISVEAFVFEKHKMKRQSVFAESDIRSMLSILFYEVMSDITGLDYPWGILYGVRPAKFMHSLDAKYSREKAEEIFKNQYLVSESKISLVRRVAENENKIISLSKPDSCSLYVSIPFCPSRCAYCSFVSHSIENASGLVDSYVDLLVRELQDLSAYIKNNNLRLETIYFGGGTPTSLSAENLCKIFEAIENNFDLSTLREYTVEAGRPDTVTPEKLTAIKNAGVQRISINPQSFNDDVLHAVGRRHTSKQTLEAYRLAEEIGFDNINMDFIAGLPADNFNSFKSSIESAVSLNAPSITVHTLSLKSGAFMASPEGEFKACSTELTSQMVDFSREYLTASGYEPYYMYRQGKCVGNLENVGWCKKGYECLYNVFMMDETHTVFAVGAGGVTRLKNQKTGKIERIYNYKYPYEYIRSFDEILKRKEYINSFYSD